MHWLNFSSATDEWWQNKIKKNAWLFGHGWTHVCTYVSFSRAVGEDTVNTWWRDFDFCSNCRAWNTAHAFKDRFHFFLVAFIRRRCWCCTARGIAYLLPAILNPLTPNDL
jgi:hypothetical protein